MKLRGPLQALQRFCGQRRNLQPQVRNWPTHPALLLATVPLLSSCIAPTVPTHEGASSQVGGWSGSEASTYRSGHSDGSQDKRQGRPHHPRPNPDQAVTRQYLRGYEDGYRNPNDNPWSQHRAQELGMQHGQRDKLAGLSMDPDRRLAKEVPQAVREHFRTGYREGWNSASGGKQIR